MPVVTNQVVQENLQDYGYWAPTEAYANLQKYKLVIFEWNALFHHTTGKALPGVADCLFLLNNFYLGKGNQRLKICISRDCPPERRSEQLSVRAKPTPEEWESLNEVMNTKGSTNGPTFKPNTVCFAISSHVRKPSNVVIEYFKTEIGQCDNFYENKKVTTWPKSETLLVGVTWRDFTTSSRSNVDFTWGSRFFGGLSGNSYWFPSSLLLDFEKKWFTWESAGVFNVQSKALVEIKWDHINFDPNDKDDDKSNDDYYAMALNITLSANALKQEILDELGLKNKFVGLSNMNLYYKKDDDSENWIEWPVDKGIKTSDGDDNPVKILLCTSADSFPKSMNTVKIHEFIIQNQQKYEKIYAASIQKIKGVLDSESRNWNVQDDLVPCISYENEKLADDEGIRLGMMENNKQRDGINTLLRNGIIGYNLDAKYEQLPEIRRIFVNIGEDENASNNTWKLVVDDTHRGNIDIDTSRISYGFSLLKGQKIGLGRKPKRVQFGKSNGDSYKLYMLEIKVKGGEKQIKTGFIAKEQREIAFRALSFYLCQNPWLLMVKEIKQNLEIVKDEQTNGLHNITLEFIETSLNDNQTEIADESFDPNKILDDIDLSYKELAEKKIKERLSGREEQYVFPLITKDVVVNSQNETKKKEKSKKEMDRRSIKKRKTEVEYRKKSEAKNNAEENLAEAIKILKEGFWAYKHKRNKGSNTKKKFFFVNESKGIMFFSDKEVIGEEAKEHHLDKGTILGEVTKIGHGTDLDPMMHWTRHPQQCMSLAGFFESSAKTVNLEFETVEECLKIYHALHYFLFLNEKDTVEDNIIYSKKNSIRGKIKKLVLGGTTPLINMFVIFVHGAICIYNSGKGETGQGSPQHIFQVEHDTRVKTKEQDNDLLDNEFKIEFKFGDLLVDKLFFKEESAIFQCADKSNRDQWVEKIKSVAANLKVEKEANQTLIQHGKNRFYDKLKNMDPIIRKMANKQGTTLGNIFNRKK